MKVLNLQCAAEHGFEGWFGSEDDFVAQSERADIACPICSSTDITRLPSAPRLAISRQCAAVRSLTARVAIRRPVEPACHQAIGNGCARCSM